MAVKSTEVSVSGSIQKESEVFSNVKGCPNIIRCFGEETTIGKNGMMVYNLLLEYCCGGTLADRIKKLDCNGLPESKVRVYARKKMDTKYKLFPKISLTDKDKNWTVKVIVSEKTSARTSQNGSMRYQNLILMDPLALLE
ncbi:mitogen-activated protein kinase kinase kinase 20 [Abeliophyllum distichum]|uniref:Mitogen-activated protein kinase kinase kinase 20 n=1 Tax=Abeliophyllum distichum TaxID=126358 RepID=A0ABD1RYC2_9LAMI